MHLPGSDNKHIKKQIIKDAAKYTSAQYSSYIFSFAGSIAMRNFLGPFYMGVWAILKVIVDYFMYSGLGTDIAVTYKIPFFKGKGDEKAEKEVVDSVFCFLLFTSIISCIVVCIAAFLLRNRYPLEIISGAFVIAVYIILQRLYTYYVMVLRGKDKFSIISKSVLFDSLVNLLLILILVKNFKIYGLYFTVILMALFNTLFIAALFKYRIELKCRLNRLISVLKFGFPLLIVGFLSTVLNSVDTIMIAKMLGVTFAGYYSIATMAKNYTFGLANNFGIVLTPKLMQSYGRNESIDTIKRFVTTSTEIVSFLLPFILGAAFFVLPVLVTVLMPKFGPGVTAVQILLLDMFFSSCYPQATQFIVALGKQSRLIPITLISIVLNVCLNLFFLSRGWGINGVAIGKSLASLFTFIIILSYAMKHFSSYKTILKFLLKVTLPMLYICSVVLFLNSTVKIPGYLLKLLVNLSVLTLMSLPLFIYIDKKTHVLRLLFGLIKTKFMPKNGQDSKEAV